MKLFFIHYSPKDYTDYTNAIHVLLATRYEIAYVEEHGWLVRCDLPVAELKDYVAKMAAEEDSVMVMEVVGEIACKNVEERVLSFITS